MNSEDIRFILERALLRGMRMVGLEVKPILAHEALPIDILGLAIRDLISRQDDIFFVQIGAHDGLTHDPIASYIRKFHWRGILIEPQPSVFAKLRANYAAEPQLIFENVAIAEKEGSLTLYGFKEAQADDHASMLTSTRRHYLSLNGDGVRGTIQAIEVPAAPLDALLDKHQVDRVDLLQIDTEGYDFAIIKSLNFSRIKPKIIHFENNFLTSRQKNECARLLSEQGYAMLSLGIDTLAYLQPRDEIFEDRIALSKVVST